jgi:hypothetical protein
MNKRILIIAALLLTFPLFGCSKPVPVTPPNAPVTAPVTTTPDTPKNPMVTENVTLNVPESGQEITSPLSIEGSARGSWYFEASFPVELQDANGNLIASTAAQAQGDWMTEEFVPFRATLDFSAPGTETGFLVLKKDNPSGLPANDAEVKVPVKFGQATEKTEVNVYFSSEKLDPEVTCTKVFPVKRMVTKSATVAKSALEELLKGPTDAEKSEQYSTAINSGVALKSVTIVDGIAKADFDKQLGFQVGGSCKVGLIRLQIEQTLKQFPAVKEVQISIDGVSGDTILQP